MFPRTPLLLAVVACGSSHGAPDAGISDGTHQATIDAACAPTTPITDCGSGGCAAIAIVGDPAASQSGAFTGYADPAVAHDPVVANRIWLAYSWPHAQTATDGSGHSVVVGAVETHLAASSDGGATFMFAGSGSGGILWPDIATADPEGGSGTGIDASETASLATITANGTTTWYGAHLRYYLQPIAGYNPKYPTSWTVRVTAAASPGALATSAETVLGVSTTAAVYAPAARLDQLAGLSISQCAILNNPTLFTSNTTLYLIVECLAFTGSTADLADSTVQVFATVPTGAPATWTWRHAGMLADHALATALGADALQQPDVSMAADGTPIAILTTAQANSSDGCSAVALTSIDPPAIARDCEGNPIVRARVSGAGYGACTHDAASATGVIGTSTASHGGPWAIHASDAAP